MCQGTELPMANSQQGTEIFNAIAHKELHPANGHWMNLEVDASPSNSLIANSLIAALWETQCWMIQQSHTHIPDP